MEWAHAVAPGAHILLVEAASQSLTDLLDADVYAAEQPGVVVVSNSWGFDVTLEEAGAYGTEPFVPSQNIFSLDGYLVTPPGHMDNDGLPGGVTFLASSGDSGTELNYPAASYYAVPVGGESITIGLDGGIKVSGPWGGSGGDETDYSAPKYHEPIVAFEADPTDGVWVYDSTSVPADGPTIQGGWSVVGGTSFSCPVWAGVVALYDQGLQYRAIGSLDTLQTMGLESYDPARPAQSAITPFGILGLAQANAFTAADLERLDGIPVATSFPLWPTTGPIPDISLTPTNGNTGYGAPNFDSGSTAGGYWGGFVQDMVGGPTGFSVFSDTLDYLGVTQQPTNGSVGTTISPITITDFSSTNDAVNTSFNGQITIQLLEAGTLIGTTTVTAVNGVATFSDLEIDKTGIYEIEATSTGQVPVTTLPFNVEPAAATQLAVQMQPASFLQSTAHGNSDPDRSRGPVRQYRLQQWRRCHAENQHRSGRSPVVGPDHCNHSQWRGHLHRGFGQSRRKLYPRGVGGWRGLRGHRLLRGRAASFGVHRTADFLVGIRLNGFASDRGG